MPKTVPITQTSPSFLPETQAVQLSRMIHQDKVCSCLILWHSFRNVHMSVYFRDSSLAVSTRILLGIRYSVYIWYSCWVCGALDSSLWVAM